MIWLAAAMVAVAAPAKFAPPLGVTLRITSEIREGTDRRFTMERVVRFSREGDGYRAELSVVAVAGEPGEASGSLFQKGMDSLLGRVIVMHLDPDGRVTAVDDMAGHWQRLCEGVAQAVASRRATTPEGRQLLAQRIIAPLRALPAEQQRDMLGSLLAVILAEEAGDPASIVPVRLPGSSPFGGATTLEGNRRITIEPGRVRSHTRAWADATIPAEGTSPARAGRVELEIEREIDPATGLILRSVTTNRTRTGSADTTRITTLSVSIVPAATVDKP